MQQEGGARERGRCGRTWAPWEVREEGRGYIQVWGWKAGAAEWVGDPGRNPEATRGRLGAGDRRK